MKKILILVGIWGGALGIFFAWNWFHVPEGNLAARFGTLPAGGYQLKEFSSGNSYNLSYWSQQAYPAQEAFDHYDKVLRAEGYRDAADWKGMGPQRRWTTRLVQGEGGHNTCVAEAHAAWFNRQGSRMVLLTLNYYDSTVRTECPLPPRSGEVFVLLQDIPTPELQGNTN